MTVPLYNLTDTWNNGATVFTAILMNVTDTGHADVSRLLDLQLGGVTKLGFQLGGTFLGETVASGGALVISSGTTISDRLVIAARDGSYSAGFRSAGGDFSFNGPVVLVGRISFGSAYQLRDLNLDREAAGILSISQPSSLPASLRVYNITDDSYGGEPTNYERGGFDWHTTANILRIRSEAAGTGTKRPIAIDAYSKSGAPTASELPAGTAGVFKDSGGGAVVIAYNDGGTIKTAALM